MAVLIWVSTGVALWHFCVLLPDRFWAGIVGAFAGAFVGAIATGLIVQLAMGRGMSDTDILTLVAALPGTALGLAYIYWLGIRQEKRTAAAAKSVSRR